jgi:hypothetical protein
MLMLSRVITRLPSVVLPMPILVLMQLLVVVIFRLVILILPAPIVTVIPTVPVGGTQLRFIPVWKMLRAVSLKLLVLL